VTITPVIMAAPVERTVLISPNFVGQPASGYLPNGYRLNHSEVALVGKSLNLAAISKIQTEPIDVSGTTHDKRFKVRLRLPLGTQSKSFSSVSGTYLVRPEPGTGDRSQPPRSTTGGTTTGGGK
jgi:YbbR domain-containing protein